jgi:hypothetical protein
MALRIAIQHDTQKSNIKYSEISLATVRITTLSMKIYGIMNTPYNDIQANDTLHNDIQHMDTEHNDAKHNDTQLNTTGIQHFSITKLSIMHYNGKAYFYSVLII